MMFQVGLNKNPVYRDGITTTLSYVFLAVKDSQPYNCVVYSQDRHVIKFYPNLTFWGLTESQVLKATGHNTYNNPDYQGIHGATKEDAAAIIKMVEFQRGVMAVNVKTFLSTDLSGGNSDSRGLHPQTFRVPSEYDMPEFDGLRPFHDPVIKTKRQHASA